MGAKIRAEHALELAKKAQRDADRAEAECDPPTRKHADLEAGGIAKMPLMQEGPVRPAGSHDQVDRDAGDRAVPVGAS